MTAAEWCSDSCSAACVLHMLLQVSLLTGGADWSASVIPASRRMGKVRHEGQAGWSAGDSGCPVPGQSVPGANWAEQGQQCSSATQLPLLGPLPRRHPRLPTPQELGTFKPMRLLPGVTMRISPSLICTRPQ